MTMIHIGTITQAHGVKGLVKIIPETDDPDLFRGEVLTDTHSITLTFKNKLGKYFLAAIDSVDDRDAAEALKGTKIYLPKDALPDNDARHMIGMDVVENDVVIGTVTSIENYGAGDLFEVALKSGETILIPNHENYVIAINDAIIVKNHEELLF